MKNKTSPIRRVLKTLLPKDRINPHDELTKLKETSEERAREVIKSLNLRFGLHPDEPAKAKHQHDSNNQTTKSAIFNQEPKNQLNHKQPQTKLKSRKKLPITVLVISWDIGHNPLGRSYMLAEAVDRIAGDTIIAGFQFDRYGTSLWEPLRDSRLPIIKIQGKDFPDFIQEANHIAKTINPDIVIVCKPRLPSMQLGLAIKEQAGCPLILDIDDHELSFFKDRSPFSLADLEQLAPRKISNEVEPYGQTWTRLTESLVDYADEILVSNSALQEKFGGVIIPHVRDETLFNPESFSDPKKIRSEFNIPTDAKVVLFFGTPRLHKGVGELAKAVGKIKDSKFLLVVVGRSPDRGVTNQLDKFSNGRVLLLPNQSFNDIPRVLSCADVVALPQDTEHAISFFQLPAKAIDAVAMGIPLLVSKTQPLMDLVNHGVASLIGPRNLHNDIVTAVERNSARDQDNFLRQQFLAHYSYESAAEKLRNVFEQNMPIPIKPLPSSLVQRLEQAELRSLGLTTRSHAVGSEEGTDFVIFWKQNDTTLYGRRHDMVIKHLASRPDVRRILVFDKPLSFHDLKELRSPANELTQDRHIYTRIQEKRLGLRDTEKIRYRVFTVPSGFYTRDKSDSRKPFFWDAYCDFIYKTFETEGVKPHKSIFWFYPKSEFATDIIQHFNPQRVVADIVDDHRSWPNVSEEKKAALTEHYRQTLSLADYVFTNCAPVQQSMSEFFDGIRLVPNGCDPEPEINESPRSAAVDTLKGWPGKVVGFVGNLEPKIDIELLERLATELPECLFALLGSTHANPAIRKLSRFSNILMPGVIPYENVGEWISHFDVAMIPHRKMELTRNMNPLKLYVYASHGVPVVSTEVANLDHNWNGLHVAKNHNNFVELTKKLLKHPGSANLSREYIQANSWDSRLTEHVDEMIQSLKP